MAASSLRHRVLGGSGSAENYVWHHPERQEGITANRFPYGK
jgi:hypothetical protein